MYLGWQLFPIANTRSGNRQYRSIHFRCYSWFPPPGDDFPKGLQFLIWPAFNKKLHLCRPESSLRFLNLITGLLSWFAPACSRLLVRSCLFAPSDLQSEGKSSTWMPADYKSAGAKGLQIRRSETHTSHFAFSHFHLYPLPFILYPSLCLTASLNTSSKTGWSPSSSW